MWISKEAEVRKKELLDTALDLFYERGYENTSINDIIKKVGVTKGSFYYHFKSKEEVLDTIALQQAQEMVGAFVEAAASGTGNCLEKINGIISGMQAYRGRTQKKRHKIFDVLDRTENLRLRQKIFDNYMRLSKPAVSELIAQGLKDGVIMTAYPPILIHPCKLVNIIDEHMLSKNLIRYAPPRGARS